MTISGVSSTKNVYKTMKIDGKISARKPIWMDGEMQGSIDCESEVVIGPTAKIKAISHSFSRRDLNLYTFNLSYCTHIPETKILLE